jgi:16S rRNA (cytosine967-C5)-methyltransferase
VRVRLFGVLRWLRALDYVLAKHCRTRLPRLDPEVRAALRLGLFEAAVLGVPAPVATDGAVHLVQRLGHGSARGLVNAVLRRAVASWPAMMAEVAADIRLSHPGWLARRWRREFGSESAVQMMAAGQEPASTWVWFLDSGVPARLREAGIELRRHPWCPEAWSAAEDHALVAVVEAGEAYAQDPGSQLVAHLVLATAHGGGLAVDLCAAPGGKAALLRSRGHWQRCLAMDLRMSRVTLARRLLERTGGCSTVCADGRKPPLAEGTCDAVLLDAPCTGTGTLRRHPELRWRLTPDSVAERSQLQKELLVAARRLVAPGGVLVYATCSVEPEENELLLVDLPERFRMERLEDLLPEGAPTIPTRAGGIRILPSLEADGFTIHALRRRAT